MKTFKIKLSQFWKHKGLVQMDFLTIETPLMQLIDLMPDETNRTEEEKNLLVAIKTVKDFIDNNKEN